MEKSRPAPSINLITEDSFSHSLLGKFFLWSLSVGRYIVVFTELIVILSFLSRFKLDRDLTDLNEDIARQKAIITSYGDLEDRIRFHQDRLALIKTNQSQLKPDQVIVILIKTTPSDIVYDQINFSNSQLELSGTSATPAGVAQLMNNLVHHPQVDQVDLSEITAGGQGEELTFSVTVSFKDVNS